MAKVKLQRDARKDVCQSATYEVQLLAEMLREKIAAYDPGAEVATLARGVLKRISELSDIIFEAVIQDESERASVDELQRRLGDT
jgi:hypothetical protein